MAMSREVDIFLADDWQLADQMRENLAILLRRGIADRVGEIDGRRTGLDRGVDDLLEKFQFRPAGILGGKLDVIGIGPRLLDRVDADPQNLLLPFLELMLAVNLGRGAENMDARMSGMLHCFARALDILGRRSRQAAHRAARHLGGDGRDGNELALRADGKPGLDNVHAHRFKMPGDLELFRKRERAAGCLFAIS